MYSLYEKQNKKRSDQIFYMPINKPVCATMLLEAPLLSFWSVITNNCQKHSRFKILFVWCFFTITFVVIMPR